jgi:hypothetical protein
MADDGDWHLAGSLSRGIGRAWLVTNHGLDDRWGQGPWHVATSTRQAGMRWLREQLDGEHGSRVPVRIEWQTPTLAFVYVDREKYAPSPGDADEL